MSLENIKNLINDKQSNGNVPETAPEATINVVKDNQNIFEENKTSYNQYNQTFDENWEDVEFTQDKALGFLWNVDSYTYTTSNGSTITVKKTDGITVKQNKQTGEIVIIGGNVEDINLSDKNNLTLIEANAKNINAKQGDATIKIEGSHSSVASITGGRGSQNVIVSAGAKVEHINTGDGDDTVIVNHSTVGKVETGSGSDGVIAYNSTITNNVDLGKDNDYVLLEESNVQGKLIATKGSNIIDASETELNDNIDLNTSDNDINTVNLSKTTINGDIDAYNGNADITIENDSTLAEDKKIRTGYGSYNVTVDNSNLDGNFVASGFEGNGSYETLNLNLNNSSFNNISGLRDDDSTTFNSANSKSNGAENVSNSAREVVPLDTNKGSEFEGFEIIKPDSENTRKVYTVKISETSTITVNEEDWKQYYCGNYQLLNEVTQNIYTLPDGTTVYMNEGGEVYTNENGEIVINGADKAEITGSNNENSKITVINSNILSQNNVSGNIEYRNSNVDAINISDSENTQITVKDDSRIGDITSNNSNLTVVALDTSKIKNIISSGEGQININFNGGEISKIQSTQADITGNIQNVTIGTIKTTKGSINLTANKSKINNIENTNQDGKTNLDFSEVTLSKITSNSISDINLNNCKVTSKIKTSDKDDILKLIDSEIENLETKQGKDNIFVHGGEFEKLTASGMSETTLDGADIDSLNVQGDVAINKSKINSFSGYGNIGIKASEIDDLNVYGDISNVASNVFIEDSLIKNDYSLYDDNAHIDYFGETKDYGDIDRAKLSSVQSKLDELSEVEFNEIYALLGNLENVDDEALAQYAKLSKEEIIQRFNEAPSETLTQIKQGLIDEMQGAITTLEQALEDDKNSGGSWWLTSIINSISNDINASNIQAKKEMLQKAIENGDIESLLNAHSILTDEISATNAIKEYNDALTYANSISNDDIGNVLTTLNYIGNLMEYNITEQDGVIKNGIAYLNMYFDIGTNRKEAAAYVQTFKGDIKALTDKYNAGTLSKEELVSEYKRLTGNSFTENNVKTILDNARNNDAFKNIAEGKIEDYQSTQQQIFQVGEYAITIVAGSAVTLASGGAAGPAIAASLSALGKMGIALTATTVSFVAKTAIDATERQTNGIVADDMTAEEIATSAALMYAGCLCGQFGNAVGDYIRGNGAEFFSQFISSKEMVDIATKVAGKTLEIGADTGASVLTTAMITGSGSFNEEFMQNLRSEMIGLIQSKITGAYFKAHPELQINAQLYSTRKALDGVAEAEANVQILKNFGFSDSDAVKLSTLTSDEVDTIVVLRATNDLCEASLKAHGIDISKLSTEEKFEQGKIVDDLYANTDSIKQQTDSTCSVVSVLNAINNKPALIQALVNKFEYDPSSDTYKFSMFGEDFEVKLNEGDNLLQKAYEAYQITYGDTKTSAIDVFNGMLDGASDIIVRPSVDNIAQLKAYSEDSSSILTFNTTDKIDGITEGHSYTVLSVDDMGNMKLQDPETLEEITLMRSQYENKDCQIDGKTYKDNGLVETGLESRMVAGKGPKPPEEKILEELDEYKENGIIYVTGRKIVDGVEKTGILYEKVLDADGNVVSVRRGFVYDSKAGCEVCTREDVLDKDGNVVAVRKKFEYGKNGEVKSCKTYSADGEKLISFDKYEKGVLGYRNFFRDGNPDKIEHLEKFRPDGTMEEKIIYSPLDIKYEYRADGETVSAYTKYDLDGNYTHRTYENDTYPRKYTEVMYDKNNKVLCKIVATELPNGDISSAIKYDANNKKVYEFEITKSSDGTITEKGKVFDENEEIKYLSERKYIEQDGNKKLVSYAKFNEDGTKYISPEVQDIYQKTLSQLKQTTPEEIKGILDEVVGKTGTSDEEVLAVMDMLTKYGSMSGMESLAQELSSRQIKQFFETGTLDANSALNYLVLNKKQLALSADGKYTGFLLDEYGFRYLEVLKNSNPQEFDELINNENIKFIYPEGWSGETIYTRTSDSQSLKDSAIDLITRAKAIQDESGVSFNEAIKQAEAQDVIARAQELGIKEVETIPSKNTTDFQDVDEGINTILKNLESESISQEELNAVIEAMSNRIFPDSKDAQKALELICGYLNSELELYSPSRLGEQMKQMHTSILEQAKTLTKSDGSAFSEDDIVYVIPNTKKSYSYIALQYAQVNGIDPSKFIVAKAEDIPKLDDNKIYVVLDDVVGTGNSMLKGTDGFAYNDIDSSKMGNRHIFISPVVSSRLGLDTIKWRIGGANRKGFDFVVAPDGTVKDRYRNTSYYKSLTSDEKAMLDMILESFSSSRSGNKSSFVDKAKLLEAYESGMISEQEYYKSIGSYALGYDRVSAFAICFPYMSPDNDAVLPSLIFRYLLLNPDTDDAIKNLPRFEEELMQEIKNDID